MCIGCWEEAGEPRVINERVINTVALIKKLYETKPTGGNLHCELDDWNLDDEFIAASRLPDSALEIERQILEALKAMSEDERYSTLALDSGYFDG